MGVRKGEKGEMDPLVPKETAYTNPYMNDEDVNATIDGGKGEGRISVCDAEVAETSKTMNAGAKGAAAPLKKTVEDMKNTKVLEKEDEEESGSWMLPAIVVGLFLLFDVGKILAEKKATHGTTINLSVFQVFIAFLNIVLAFVVSLVMDKKKGWDGMFDKKTFMQFMWPALFFSVSALFNLMQNLYLKGGARKVFSQLRIPLTAGFSRVIMGHGYTGLQWIIFVMIVVSVFQFHLLCEPREGLFTNAETVIGIIFSVITNICAVIGSLVSEKMLKDAKKNPFYIQKFQIEFWTMIFAIAGAFVTQPVTNGLLDYWQKGTFFGPKFEASWITTYKIANHKYTPAYAPSAAAKWTSTRGYHTKAGGAAGTWQQHAVELDNIYNNVAWERHHCDRLAQATRGQLQYPVLPGGGRGGVGFDDPKFDKMYKLFNNLVSAEKNKAEDVDDAPSFKARQELAQGEASTLSKAMGAHKGYYTKNPFGHQPGSASGETLAKNFLFALSEKTDDDTFVPLKLLRRDGPTLDTLLLTRETGNFESKKQVYFTYDSSMSADDVERLGKEAAVKKDEKTDASLSKKPVVSSDRQFIFAETAEYPPAGENKLTLHLTRTQQDSLYLNEKKSDFKRKVQTEGIKIVFQVDEDKRLDHSDGSLETKFAVLTIADVERTTQVPVVWFGSSKDDAAQDNFVASQAGPAVPGGNLWTSEDVLADNRVLKFWESYAKFAEKYVKGKKFTAATYPGILGAGRTVFGDARLCDKTCRVLGQNSDEFAKSWNYLTYDSDFAGQKQDKDPFKWAQIHKYTRNPLPSVYMFKIPFIFAVVANAGQSWMSGFISKVLSSLWKNICAAVALALVVLIERAFMLDVPGQADIDWTRTVLATMGVLSAVFLFQLAPKAPKPAPKPEEKKEDPKSDKNFDVEAQVNTKKSSK